MHDTGSKPLQSRVCRTISGTQHVLRTARERTSGSSSVGKIPALSAWPAYTAETGWMEGGRALISQHCSSQLTRLSITARTVTCLERRREMQDDSMAWTEWNENSANQQGSSPANPTSMVNLLLTLQASDLRMTVY